MEKELVSTKYFERSDNASAVFQARTEVRSTKQRGISDEKLATTLTEIRRKLTEGLSSAAEKIITATLANLFAHARKSSQTYSTAFLHF